MIRRKISVYLDLKGAKSLKLVYKIIFLRTIGRVFTRFLLYISMDLHYHYY